MREALGSWALTVRAGILLLIVCPAGLTLQWRDEMRDKFGLDFRIVDAQLLGQLRRRRGLYLNPWTHYRG